MANAQDMYFHYISTCGRHGQSALVEPGHSFRTALNTAFLAATTRQPQPAFEWKSVTFERKWPWLLSFLPLDTWTSECYGRPAGWELGNLGLDSHYSPGLIILRKVIHLSSVTFLISHTSSAQTL